MQKSVAYEPPPHSLTLIKIKQNYGFKKLYQARASSPVFSRCYSSSSQCSPDAMDPAHPRPSPEARRHRLRQELQGVHPDASLLHPLLPR